MSDFEVIFTAVFLILMICAGIIVSPINGIISLIVVCIIAYGAFKEHKK